MIRNPKIRKVFEGTIEVEPDVNPHTAITNCLKSVSEIIAKSPLPMKQNPRGFNVKVLIEVCDMPNAGPVEP